LQSLRALRRYRVESQRTGQIVTRYAHRRLMFRARIDYNARGYTVHYINSAGFKTKHDGRLWIDARYAKLMIKLSRVVDKYLRRGARPPRHRRQRPVDPPPAQPRDMPLDTERPTAPSDSSEPPPRQPDGR
jgi:hypothetical protein